MGDDYKERIDRTIAALEDLKSEIGRAFDVIWGDGSCEGYEEGRKKFYNEGYEAGYAKAEADNGN